jgi:hypothetical protein
MMEKYIKMQNAKIKNKNKNGEATKRFIGTSLTSIGTSQYSPTLEDWLLRNVFIKHCYYGYLCFLFVFC